MPRAKKKKIPIAPVESASSSSNTPLSSRTTIRLFHALLKRRTQLQAASAKGGDVSETLSEIEHEIAKLGGLEQYQRMSAAGQRADRGGGSQKVLIEWLKGMGLHQHRTHKLRLLDVGALKFDNYRSYMSWIEPTPMDLRPRHPLILQQDFLQLDVAQNHEKWDVISLSLVLNFVPESKDRGRMLRLAYDLLEPNGHLYLVLPLPCVANSRYLDFLTLKNLMEALGFTELKKRWKEGRKMAYWLFQKTKPSGRPLEYFQKKSVIRQQEQLLRAHLMRYILSGFALPEDVSYTNESPACVDRSKLHSDGHEFTPYKNNHPVWQHLQPMARLSILHWNDAYRISPQKLSSKSKGTIDVAQFAAIVEDLRKQWSDESDPATEKGEGLVLFSGDVFSPSVESSVTRGSHMVPVMNMLAPDASLTGNHDFDFGYPHLSKLVQGTTFPWILSNIVDSETSRTPQYLHEFQVFERGGLRIGVIGLVEEDWIATVAAWPSNFIFKDMTETGMDLSKRLRDPQGKYRCDLIIALTHSRLPNDMSLAKGLFALSPSAQRKSDISRTHGVDLLLGGHDHFYYVSRGVTSWKGYNTSQSVLGAEEDQGDILLVKSGTDFRELSELNLEFEMMPLGCLRNALIKRITGKRHIVEPGSVSSEPMQRLLKTLLSSVSGTLKAPVCQTATILDCHSQLIRTAESAASDWFADVIRHAYDDALCMKGCGGSDGVFICAGTFRGDSAYGPGVMTLGNILEILPFEDPIVVLELDGAAIWDALESSLSTWPAQEGRFPSISGFRVSWDSRRKPGDRVTGVWLLQERDGSGEDPQFHGEKSAPRLVNAEAISRTTDGRKYNIVTREYMAQGHDGYLAFQGKPHLINSESGYLMSSIVRKYLLGSHFVNKMVSLTVRGSPNILRPRTEAAVSRELVERRKLQDRAESKAVRQWKRAANAVLQGTSKNRSHYQDRLSICTTEHMSIVDPFDGESVRSGQSRETEDVIDEDDLLVIAPEIDGRLKDEGRK